MTALTQDRDTRRRDGNQVEPPVAATTRIHGGAIVCVNAAGLAVPGATSTTLKAVGVAEHRADNTAGAAGAMRVRCRKGPHRFANSAAADAITLADVGNDCYIVDDQTVAKTHGTNTRSVAGKIFDVDADGVWVDFR
ncbi:MAG: hypothetical protein KKB95_09440 [Gammaproteobacteria bacterium]|nr:hypothetical protein [Gammaproteobacteria bacterium]MBU1505784.1 hypothetical protein [Gammaproteobacteria bacterium]MBU2119472.1 hypothetical protein [Gammaproteobacteria bacterium]MBU2172622.1 hypothetical protein [Gammaproteobacteria bacterium]MBU2202080.1 hypothetical protein [Gammaproteobacteria bacterium]